MNLTSKMCIRDSYKDVCNPITAEFREELYTNILDAYARIKEPEKEETPVSYTHLDVYKRQKLSRLIRM